MNKYEKLFTPIRIGNRILKNRGGSGGIIQFDA